MTDTKTLLAEIASTWAARYERGDLPLAAQTEQTFDEAGGFVGWNERQKRVWRMPSGRRTTRQRRALEAWANLSK